MLTTLDELHKDSPKETPPNSFLGQDAVTDWSRFRRVSAPSQQRVPQMKVRKVLLALAVTLLLFAAAVLVRFRMPALVSFAKEVRSTASTFVSRSPANWNAKRRVADLQAGTVQIRNPRSRLQPENDNGTYLRVPGPFEAVAIVGDRRIRMVPTGRIVILDVESGTWTTATGMPE